MLLLAVFGFRLFPQQDVTVLTSGQSYRVSATFDTQSEALTAADIELNPGDRVLLGTGGRHTSLAVQRARPIVVDADGRAVEVRTQATTISGALADAGIDLRPGDRVYLDGQLATARGPLFGASYASRNVISPGPVTAGAQTGAVRVAIVRARPVTVVVDTLPVETASAAADVQGLLADLGLTVLDGDLVRPPLATPITAGMTVRLAKARTVSVKVDGKDQLLYTQANTVADVLRLLAIELGPEDTVDPAPATYLSNGLTITIVLTRQVEEEVRIQIAAQTVTETDPTLAAGQVRVIPGVPGERVTKFMVTYRNGAEVSRSEISGGGVVREPVPTRQVTGTRPSPAPSRPTLNAPGYTGAYKTKMTVVTTWYNAAGGAYERGDPNYGRTATGAIVDYGICAVDRNVIPLGTRFYVPDYGMCLAADTGSAIQGNIVDLGFPESAGNVGWGRRTSEIYIVD
ncbi:MAG: DUF348 domain-containing protein [Chloroflexi bacterium]|nr:DUF348 domain-containing protein [Chloroflexota bacterium]